MHGCTGMLYTLAVLYWVFGWDDANAAFSYCTEIEGHQEEHHQLPPDENVPQGCWTPQEERCSGLKDLNNRIRSNRDSASTSAQPTTP